ncbi:hypothetical protein ACFL35_06440 [Candidatus Riflebacteria bacterium]
MSNRDELNGIDPKILKRSPLITKQGYELYLKMREHTDAPKWTYTAGDMVGKTELKYIKIFKAGLKKKRRKENIGDRPPLSLLKKFNLLHKRIISFMQRVPEEGFLNFDWEKIHTMCREDIAKYPEKLIPVDADLERMNIYQTAGTTGHALMVPNAAEGTGCYLPMLDFVLARYGVKPVYKPGRVACFLIGAQKKTVTYPTVLSYWKQSGFAKININPSEWPTSTSPHHFFTAFKPQFLTGDPISFAEMLRMQIPVKPAALVTTAVAMSAGLKRKLATHYNCPVIDWYSLTETGPIGYFCPKSDAYHILPHDIYVEALDSKGRKVAAGKRGEITISGGRNPFLPLLRYRTGDWGRLDFTACTCGDIMPRIFELEGREPVIFRAFDGKPINPIDVSRIIRAFPIVQHQFLQKKNGACEIAVRPIISDDSSFLANLQAALLGLFGAVKISVKLDMKMGNRKKSKKIIPYKSQCLLYD